jgi:hypothetical protein
MRRRLLQSDERDALALNRTGKTDSKTTDSRKCWIRNGCAAGIQIAFANIAELK